MKIGRERTPLKERLNEQAESQANQAAGLMQSALKTFENDCTTSLNAARLTIENDIQSLTKASARMNRSVRPIIVITSLTSLIVVLINLVASWYWASTMIDKAQSASLWQLGLTVNQTDNGTVLSLDEKRLRLIDCRIGTASAKCLQLLEKE